jgi:hypothetical protein
MLPTTNTSLTHSLARSALVERWRWGGRVLVREVAGRLSVMVEALVAVVAVVVVAVGLIETGCCAAF